MCDTFVIMPDASQDGSLIFGKNSDREPNEAHQVVLLPASDYPPHSEVRCTYRSIPQAAHTHAVLLLKPFWIWGAEMGANEFGVVIGNEAVFTREKAEKGAALIGMDYIRLALERAASADEALHVMVDLLAQYGQGGNCGFTHPFYYQNSFIIADAHSAWVLETSGKEWAAEKVSGVRSISNAITIGSEWTMCSAGLVENAVRRGWSKRAGSFNFARDYSEPVYTRLSAAQHRQACTTALLQARRGELGVADAFSVLRSHSAEGEGSYHPDAGLTGAEVCMHAGWGPVRNSQSVGSLVAQISPQRQTYWVTGTSAPCTSVFKPVWFVGGIPWQAEPAPGGTYDPQCLWWRHEQVHRRVIQNHLGRMPLIEAQRQQLERQALARVSAAEAAAEEYARVSQQCFQDAEEAERAWVQALHEQPAVRTRFYYQIAWQGFNHQAEIGLEN